MRLEKPIVKIVNPVKGGLPQYFNVLLVHQSYPKQLYSYSCDTVISDSEEKSIISRVTSNLSFSLTKVLEGGKPLVRFESLETHISNSNSEAQKMSELGKLFAMPISKLVLELDSKGSAAKVLNNAEIASKWQELFSYISEGMDEKTKTMIKNSGDHDFLDPIRSLKRSFLHSFLFLPIFNHSFSSYKVPDVFLYNTSKLLENIDADYMLSGKVLYVDKDVIVIEYRTSFDNDGSMLSKARKIYGSLVPSKSKFHFEVLATTHIDINKGMPLFMDIHYIEHVEGAIKYIQISTIKLLS